MKITIVSAEVAPFSKTGGLADVAGALPFALKENGASAVTVISPLYRMVSESGFKLKRIAVIEGVPEYPFLSPFELFSYKTNGVEFIFLKKDEYYDRVGLYGTPQSDFPDNAQRFSFLCSASLAAALYRKSYPDIIHINDWETALVPFYRDMISDKSHPLRKAKALFSIHNLAYQGRFSKDAAAVLNLPDKLLGPLMAQDSINFMKGGILHSDVLTTVSKRYAQEILTDENGCGLHAHLQSRKKDLYGIVNGADYANWDPAIDGFIPEHYDAASLDKKLASKKQLLKEMNIDLPADRPLIGSVGRLAHQKGVDVIIDCVDRLMEMGAGLVILGKGDEQYEQELQKIARDKKGKVGMVIAFDNRLAHLIEAGADMFVMPSRYEPCGLNQMYSLKYGTIPVVSATGGLDDTIVDYDADPAEGNGFKFRDVTSADLIDAVKRAIAAYDDKDRWRKLQKRGMAQDFSWRHSGEEYLALYRKVMAKR